jgi:hypothetical protein
VHVHVAEVGPSQWVELSARLALLGYLVGLFWLALRYRGHGGCAHEQRGNE